MIVGPYSPVVVGTSLGHEPIVYGIFGVDHPGIEEPGVLLPRQLEEVSPSSSGRVAIREMSEDGEV